MLTLQILLRNSKDSNKSQLQNISTHCSEIDPNYATSANANITATGALFRVYSQIMFLCNLRRSTIVEISFRRHLGYVFTLCWRVITVLISWFCPRPTAELYRTESRSLLVDESVGTGHLFTALETNIFRREGSSLTDFKVRVPAGSKCARPLCFGPVIHAFVAGLSNKPSHTQVDDTQTNGLGDCSPGSGVGNQPLAIIVSRKK